MLIFDADARRARIHRPGEAPMEPAQEDDDEKVVSDKAWNRLLAEKKTELRRLADQGALASRRSGRRLLLRLARRAGAPLDRVGQGLRRAA
jgi:hypothetical protein